MNPFIKKHNLLKYQGRILHGEYSDETKDRLAGLVAAFDLFDKTGVPGIPYITVWSHDDNVMWYEFAGRQFTELFGVSTKELAEAFRNAVVDHRRYHWGEVEAGIEETALGKQELSGRRNGLRAEVSRKGNVEADYKVALPGSGNLVWFKDQASIEIFGRDRLSISFGFLTDVTNEMMHKDLLEQIGYFDQLTGLPNRAIMHRSLELKIAEYRRNHIDDFVFMLMEIDHFKGVNESFGRKAGDYVLATLGQVINDMKRRSDDMGRYDAEIFYGIALADNVEGKSFAERIRLRIEATPFVSGDQSIPVTVSIGVVAASEIRELSEENLLAEAEQRLSRAKQYGRNQVVWEKISFEG